MGFQRLVKLVMSLLVWSAILLQFFLILGNRTTGVPETIIRFFSFFTILTNIFVALYFTSCLINRNQVGHTFWDKPGRPTGLTIYITVVGAVYQILLRDLWVPTGWQLVVDELLHSVIPVLTLLHWIFFADKSGLTVKLIPEWLVYPLVYLVYILILGTRSGFYPYPFVNVNALGYGSVLFNSSGLVLVFVLLSFIFIAIGNRLYVKAARNG